MAPELWLMFLTFVLGTAGYWLLALLGDWVLLRKERREMEELNRDHKEND